MKLNQLTNMNVKIFSQLLMLFGIFTMNGQTNPTAQTLPYSQDFSGLAYNSNVFPSGLQGWQLGTSAPPGATWRTSAPTADVTMATNASASSTGGTTIQNYNGKIGFLHSGASEVSLALAINTSSLTNVQLNYNVMTIRNPYDGTTNTRIIENIIQYRVGTTGTFTNLTSVAYQNNTTLQTTAGVTTPQKLESRTIILPIACNNQPIVQIRWVSRDVSGAAGTRPSIAVDDINVKSITPSITTSGTLSAVPATYGTASSNTSFSFTAANLTADATVTAPTGFEISTSPSSGFASSLTIPQTAGSIASTTIYVRLAATTLAGSYSGNISLSGFSSATNSTATATVATVSSTVSPKELTISGISIADKNFDGNTTATILGTATLEGIQNSDSIVLGGTPVATFSDSTVGNNKPVTVSGYTFSGTNASSYYLTQPTGLTASIYSTGLSDQTISFGALSPVTYGDANFDLTATSDSGLSISYSSSNTSVATISGSTVTIVGFGSTTITASQGGNSSYNPALPVNQNLVVNKKSLTISGATAVNKIYDGSTSATISGGSLVGVLPADLANVSFSGGGTFDIINVGTAINVTGNLILTGSSAGNYALTQPILAADITPKGVTITGISISNKEFDNSTSATIIGTAALNGVVAADNANVVLGGTAVALFDDVTVANGKSVTVSGYSISGSASGNYSLSQPAGFTANITPKTLTISGLTAESKTYDRTTTVVLTGTPSLTGVLLGDEANVSLDGTPEGSFIDFNVGLNKTVTVTGFTISGASSANYSLAALNLTASITAKEVTILNASVSDKNYDGTTTATLSGTLSGVISPDDTTVNLLGTFNNSFVGNGKPVTSTSTLLGVAATNYFLTQPTGLAASIFAIPCATSTGTALWDFTSGATTGITPSTTVSGVTVSNITQGNNNGTTTYITSSASSTGYAGVSGTFNASTACFVGALNTSTSTYHEFTITPTPGFVYSFTSMSFGSRSTGTGPQLYSLRSSLDGYATNLASASMPNNSVWNLYTTPSLGVANQTGAITFRLYGSNGAGSPVVGTSNWRVDDITLNITASPSSALSSATTASACSGSTFTYTPTTNYTGATITWTRAAVAGISNAAVTTPQSGNISESLVNTTSAPVNVVYAFNVTTNTCFLTQNIEVTVLNSGTWIGGSSSWNNAANWCGGIPTASTNVVISNGNPVLDVNHTVASGSTLTLSGTAGLTINPDSILTIDGNVDFGGRPVTLKSDSTGDAAIGQITGTLSNATNVSVERYIPSKRAWRALTAPLNGSNTSLYSAWQNNGSTIANTGVALWGPSGTGLATGPAYNIRRYTTSGWVDVTNTQSTNLFTTEANNAFMVFVTGEYGSPNIGNGQSAATTLKATGELITGTVNYSLSSTNHTLIGNPYASPISPAAILSNSANTNTALLFPYLWVWNPAYNTNGAYELYDKVAGTYSGGNLSAGTAIQSGQAFFVRTETAASSLTLTETMKSSSISNTFRNSNSIAPSIFRASFLKQTATDWMPLDGCIAAFYEGANQAADDADGKKMINTGENIGFVRNAINLSSEHYPLVTAQDILSLKIWNTQQARYKLKLNTEEFTMTGVEAWLQDLYTGTSQQLNLDGSVQEYEFDVDPTVSASSGTRFKIVFTNTALAVDTPTQGQLSIYPNPATGGKVTVSLPTGNFEGCSYQLINVLGQVVSQDQIENRNGSQVSISTAGLPNSWYALRIIKENSVMYQGKLIIKN